MSAGSNARRNRQIAVLRQLRARSSLITPKETGEHFPRMHPVAKEEQVGEECFHASGHFAVGSVILITGYLETTEEKNSEGAHGGPFFSPLGISMRSIDHCSPISIALAPMREQHPFRFEKH